MSKYLESLVAINCIRKSVFELTSIESEDDFSKAREMHKMLSTFQQLRCLNDLSSMLSDVMNSFFVVKQCRMI